MTTRPRLPEIHWRTLPTNPRPEPATLFERCVRIGEEADVTEIADLDAITRAILTTLRDGTKSLRTAEEIDRVLAEAGS